MIELKLSLHEEQMQTPASLIFGKNEQPSNHTG